MGPSCGLPSRRIATSRAISPWRVEPYMNAFAYSRLPDAWLGIMTPWLPFLVALAAVLIWATAIVRNRREALGTRPAGSARPAG